MAECLIGGLEPVFWTGTRMAPDRPQTGPRAAGWTALAILAVVEVAVVAVCALALMPAAQAQIDERFPFLENRQRRNQQQQQQQQQQHQQWNQPWTNQGGYGQERQAPAESTRAPAPRRPDVTPAVNVLVFGDSMSEWLAYGLEEAFAETPEIGILRKPRPNTGLIRVEQRGESYDWPVSARDILNAEKPDFVVMMLGTADRRGIREAIRQQPARPPAGQKQDQAKQPAPAQPGQPAQAAQPAPPAAEAAKPVDSEAPPADAAAAEQPSTAPPEGVIAGTVVHEFRSEKWGELYAKRVDEMIGVLKAKGAPVLWVGLPPIRGTRATSDMVYLNDLYRGRAEKAGIVYVDVWDGFVDDAGNYNNYGADFEGQTRRLRTGDGLHFTRPGARKLAHYAEREIRRLMLTRATPLASTPQEPEPEPETKAPPTAAAPDREPGDVAHGAARRRRHAARRRTEPRCRRGFRGAARAGAWRADRSAGRTRGRLHLAAPRHRDRDRRAAARPGRGGARGGNHDGAGRDHGCGTAAAPRAAAPAAPAAAGIGRLATMGTAVGAAAAAG
jgi:uncharacterized protein